MTFLNKRLIDLIASNQITGLFIDSIDPRLCQAESATELQGLLLSAVERIKENSSISVLSLKNLPSQVVDFFAIGFNHKKINILILDSLNFESVISVACNLAYYPDLQAIGFSGLTSHSLKTLLDTAAVSCPHLSQLNIGSLHESAMTTLLKFLEQNRRVTNLIIDTIGDEYKRLLQIVLMPCPWLSIEYSDRTTNFIAENTIAATLAESPIPTQASYSNFLNDPLSGINDGAAYDQFDLSMLVASISPDVETSPTDLPIATSSHSESFHSSDYVNTTSASDSFSQPSTKKRTHAATVSEKEEQTSLHIVDLVRKNQQLAQQLKALKQTLAAKDQRIAELTYVNAQLQSATSATPLKLLPKTERSQIPQPGFFSGAAVALLNNSTALPKKINYERS